VRRPAPGRGEADEEREDVEEERKRKEGGSKKESEVDMWDISLVVGIEEKI
jgi:hypothetical protein